jgi:two-component system response regulator GlrR
MSSHAEHLALAGARRRPERLVGTSRAMQVVAEQIALAGRGRFPVWIHAEDGIDKELVAHLVHEASEWATGAFFALDAASIPRTLIARELLGAEPGAVAGLPGAYDGAFARTRGGTLLVENLEHLPKDLQQILAAALERSRYRRVGATAELPLESRFVASSRFTLDAVIADGRLVPELAAPLRVLAIEIPPLRERREDVVPIAAQALAQARREVEEETGERCSVRGFAPETLERLAGYPWFGNERELRERIRAAVRLAKADEIEPGDLSLGGDSAESVPSFREAKRAFEREYVMRVLRLCDGNISRAARLAKKDRKDFYDVMRRNRIDPSEFRG